MFAAIIFVPGVYLSRLVMALMFVLMIALVVLYWFVMFWVKKSEAQAILGHEIENDLFVGKLPVDPAADLDRGRLCRDGDRLVLIKRSDGKEKNGQKCDVVWSVDIDDIKSVGFGKILPARKGFILYLDDDEVKFTSFKVSRNKDLLYKALGWDVPKAQA